MTSSALSHGDSPGSTVQKIRCHCSERYDAHTTHTSTQARSLFVAQRCLALCPVAYSANVDACHVSLASMSDLLGSLVECSVFVCDGCSVGADRSLNGVNDDDSIVALP